MGGGRTVRQVVRFRPLPEEEERLSEVKRWMWNLAKRWLRSEMLRDIDAVLGQAHEHMVIDARQLHVLDSALKGDMYGVGYTRTGGAKMRAIFPAQGRDTHAHLWWQNAARSIARSRS